MTLSPPQSPTGRSLSWPAGGVSRVPYWLYTDPAVYEREVEMIFRGSSWCYVGLAAEVPAPGTFRRSMVGPVPVVLTRDIQGALHVLVNRCAHRGVQFCQAQRGEATTFTCPYHQWTFGLDGSLRAVPFRRGVHHQGGLPPDFELDEHGLERLAVTERHGVVFASFDPGLPPIEEYLGDRLRPLFDRVFDGRELEVLGYLRQRVAANWKLMFENIKDPYHATLLHVFLVTFGLFRADQPSATVISENGAHCALVSRKGAQTAVDSTGEMRSFRADLRLADPRLLDVVREFPGDATVVMHTVWPNLIIQQQSNTLATRHLVPRGPEQFDLHWTFFGYADDTDEMRTRRLRQANLMGPAGLVSIDDGEMMEFSQSGVAHSPQAAGFLEMGGHGVDSQDHMVTEAGVRAFYSYYRSVMDL